MGRPSKYKPEFAQRVKMLPCSVCDAPGPPGIRLPGLDGLADVLGVDDSRWALSAELAGEVGGFVRVEVRPCHA